MLLLFIVAWDFMHGVQEIALFSGYPLQSSSAALGPGRWAVELGKAHPIEEHPGVRICKTGYTNCVRSKLE